MSPWVSSG